MSPATPSPLAAVGLPADLAARLAAEADAAWPLAAPPRTAEERVLAAALAAARDPATQARWLPPLLECLRATDLEAPGRAVYLHLEGLVRWRSRQDVPGATRALNESLALLERADAADAARYRPRVRDTLGQMLHHQGLLGEARHELEQALAEREGQGDLDGAALTRGNLGRLCMELGDFGAAHGHLAEDLAHVEATGGGGPRVRGQLLTQIGVCLTELDRRDDARQSLEQSLSLAAEAGDVVGRAFATIYLGRLALRAGDLKQGARRAAEARVALADLPDDLARELGTLVLVLAAEVERRSGDVRAALELFARAETEAAAAHRLSPVEHAELLGAYADACVEAGETALAAGRLQKALRALDATTAERLRSDLDARLRALDEGAWMLHSAGRFVGHEQIEFLLGEAGQAGFRGHAEEVTVLFSDLRGFTTVTEGLDADTLISMLNRYLALMTRCVEHFGGTVDKFIGDAVMALFSLPTPRPDDADRALAAARYMQAELARMNRSLPTGVPPLASGIGLHVGRVVAGLIGSPRKRSYTVVGDVVNTASRLEGMTKQLGAPLLVTRELVGRLRRPDAWLLCPLGRFRPKGRRGDVEVLHVLGERDGSLTARDAEAEIAEAARGLASLQAGRFGEAADVYRALARRHAGGGRAYPFLAAQAAALESVPPPRWDGTIVLTEK